MNYLKLLVAIAMFSILGVFTENTNAREYDESENLEEEIALMEDSLELIYEKGVVTNEKGYFLGYNRGVFENVLSKYDDYEGVTTIKSIFLKNLKSVLEL